MRIPNRLFRLNPYRTIRRVESLAVSLMAQVQKQADVIKTAHRWSQAQDKINQQMATMLQRHELRLHLIERRQGGVSLDTTQDPEIIYWQRKGPEA